MRVDDQVGVHHQRRERVLAGVAEVRRVVVEAKRREVPLLVKLADRVYQQPVALRAGCRHATVILHRDRHATLGRVCPDLPQGVRDALEGRIGILRRAHPSGEDAQDLGAERLTHLDLGVDLRDLGLDIRRREVVASGERDDCHLGILRGPQRTLKVGIGGIEGQVPGRVRPEVHLYVVNAHLLRGGEVLRQLHLAESPCGAGKLDVGHG